MTRIYLITPPVFDPHAMRDAFAAALDAGDVACVQLRLKDAKIDIWKKAIDILMPLAWERDVAFLLNDHPDLALSFGADGVHLGKDDMPFAKARGLLGADKIIGTSCYDSKDKAMHDSEEEADYIAFGAAFPTQTKTTDYHAPIGLFEDWTSMATTPVVAIGGITPFNCGPLVKANVDFLAVISCVWDHPESPAAGVKALQWAINRA